jgi:hypothetical protein
MTADAIGFLLLLNGLAGLNAGLLLSFFPPLVSPERGCLFLWGDRILRGSLLTVIIIIASEIGLGLIGAIGLGTLLGLHGGLLLVLLFLRRRRPGATLTARDRVRLDHDATASEACALPAGRAWDELLALGAAGIIGAWLILALWNGLRLTPSAYDALTYHLFFPARWLQSGFLELIATPFGDNAPTYAPANGELWFLWLMLPGHNDVFARVGQFPWAILTGLGLFLMLRLLGVSEKRALWAPIVLFLAQSYLCQSIAAYVDIFFSFGLVAALYFLLRYAIDGPSRWLFWSGLATGLAIGAKYAALVYLPGLFLLLTIALAWRWRQDRPENGPNGAIWGGLARLLGLYLLGLCLPSLYWYGRNFFLTGSPIYPGSLTMLGRTIFAGAYTPDVMVNSPFHVTGLANYCGVITATFGAMLRLILGPIYLISLLDILWRRQFWPAGFWLFLPIPLSLLYWYGIPYNSEYRFLFPVLALVSLAPAWLLQTLAKPGHYPRLRRGAGFGLALLLLGLVLFLTGRFWQFRLDAGPSLRLPPPNFPGQFIPAWQVIAHLSRKTPLKIAYSGNNIPYHLLGSDLTNHVNYIQINAHPTWQFHDFDRWLRQKANYQPPTTPKPDYYRRDPEYSAWLANLQTAEINVLFISTLSPDEAEYLWHDPEGFPIEETWAEQHPGEFRRLFGNRVVRIYRLTMTPHG